MAPASTAGARQAVRAGRATRDEKRQYIISRIRRWVELYGEPPRAADWNPSSARWSDQLWRVDRYRQGDPEDRRAVAVAERGQGAVRRQVH